MSYIYLMVSFNPFIRNNRIIKKTSVYMHIRKQYNIIVIFFFNNKKYNYNVVLFSYVHINRDLFNYSIISNNWIKLNH